MHPTVYSPRDNQGSVGVGDEVAVGVKVGVAVRDGVAVGKDLGVGVRVGVGETSQATGVNKLVCTVAKRAAASEAGS